MSEVADFLLARIAEDEAAAREAAALFFARARHHTGSDDTSHFSRWDPARVLAECEAKRRVVDNYRAVPDGMQEHYRAGLGRAIQCLVLAYANHPDFRREWSRV